MFPNNKPAASALVSKLSLAFIAGVALVLASGAFANPGDLYVTDLATGSVIRYEPDGTAHTFATGLVSPQGIAFGESAGPNPAFFYVADAGDGSAGNGKIEKYDLAGNETLFASGLNNPAGVAVSGGSLLVSEFGADRVLALPLNGDPAIVFKIITEPLGVDSRVISPGGLTAFIANGDSVLKVAMGQTDMDIDPSDGSRSVAATLGGNVFVTTDAGTVTKVFADGSPPIEFTSGLVDPHGLDLQPSGVPGVDTGNVFVADTGAHTIFKVANNGSKTPFVMNAGDPNYVAFETGSPGPTPTPTPTPTATPTPTPTATPTPTPPPSVLNISSRADVETDANVAIAGFIIDGADPKLVIVRGIGPSLAAPPFNLPGVLADPKLDLYDEAGAIIASNDNWMADPSMQTVIDQNLAPSDPNEAAFAMTLPAGKYTAILQGTNGSTGIGLVEVYDKDDPSSMGSDLGNLSTRALVGTGDNVLIGGIIVGGGGDVTVVVRAIGPELANVDPPVPNPLADPVLELFNPDGDSIAMNDNWMDLSAKDQAVLTSNNLAPADDAESAIVANLVAGQYTAIVTGKDATTGVGLVEVYPLPAQATKGAGQ